MRKGEQSPLSVGKRLRQALELSDGLGQDEMSNAQSGGTTFGLPGGRMTLQFFRAIVGRHRE